MATASAALLNPGWSSGDRSATDWWRLGSLKIAVLVAEISEPFAESQNGVFTQTSLDIIGFLSSSAWYSLMVSSDLIYETNLRSASPIGTMRIGWSWQKMSWRCLWDGIMALKNMWWHHFFPKRSAVCHETQSFKWGETCKTRQKSQGDAPPIACQVHETGSGNGFLPLYGTVGPCQSFQTNRIFGGCNFHWDDTHLPLVHLPSQPSRLSKMRLQENRTIPTLSQEHENPLVSAKNPTVT